MTVAYYRVSTAKQGQSGLGLEAQQATVRNFLGDMPAAEFVEVESGKKNDRPELAKALTEAKLRGCPLVVAKMDRLSRNASFLNTIIDSEANVIFCDMPEIPANESGKFILRTMANVAVLERGLISERTKAGLAAAKARGVKLGGYRGGRPDRIKANAARSALADEYNDNIRHKIDQLEPGLSYGKIAEKLNALGFKTRRGGKFHPEAVRRIIQQT